MNRTANRFARGSAVYTCRCCKRTTRQTGRGDNDLVNLCAECYDLGGEENHLSDNGKFYGSPLEVLKTIAEVARKGGDASCWEALRKAADKAATAAETLSNMSETENAMAAARLATKGLLKVSKPEVAPTPTEVKVALQTASGPVVTAYPVARKMEALVLIAGYMADNKTFTVSYE